jgi:primase-polymerase (primpol)-like protein
MTRERSDTIPIDCPDDLIELDQWVLWCLETRNGRPTKIPYQLSGRPADITEPSTWISYDRALGALRCNTRRYSGLGFVFSKQDPYAGIDLDNALDNRGCCKPWARGIVERFGDTYMEISPSGQGLKIWARGVLPANLPGARVADGSVEMYDHARYFTVTGRAFRGAPLQVEEHVADLLALYERLTSGRKHPMLQPETGGRIPYGQQHNTLVSIMGTLRRRHVCEEAIEACLQAINEHQCEKPGPRQNITRMVRSSRSWGMR